LQKDEMMKHLANTTVGSATWVRDLARRLLDMVLRPPAEGRSPGASPDAALPPVALPPLPELKPLLQPPAPEAVPQPVVKPPPPAAQPVVKPPPAAQPVVKPSPPAAQPVAVVVKVPPPPAAFRVGVGAPPPPPPPGASPCAVAEGPTPAELHVAALYRAEGLRTGRCVGCNKGWTEAHESSETHVATLTEAMALDVLLGHRSLRALAPAQCKAHYTKKLRASEFASHWCGTADWQTARAHFLREARAKLRQTGVLVRLAKSKPLVRVEVSDVKDVLAVPYSGVGHYDLQGAANVAFPLGDVDAAPESPMGWWPVVSLQLPVGPHQWVEDCSLPCVHVLHRAQASRTHVFGCAPFACVSMLARHKYGEDTEMPVLLDGPYGIGRTVVETVACVYQLTWILPTAWPVRRLTN
jgi:hypothetical protein